MENPTDYEAWDARWRAQQLEWELERLSLLGKAVAILEEIKVLEALIDLAASKVDPPE